MEKATKKIISRYYPMFQTQREAIDYVREGLYHHIGERVNSLTDPDYYQELLVLLESHPNFDRKFSDVNVLMINPLYNEHDDVFVLDLVTNIGHLDVSWRRCAANLVRIQKGKVLDPNLILRRSVLRAMRLEVQEQLQDFVRNISGRIVVNTLMHLMVISYLLNMQLWIITQNHLVRLPMNGLITLVESNT